MKKLALISLATLLVSGATASAKEPKAPPMSGLQLQQFQSHEFNYAYGIVFSSTLSVLQDLGYVIKSGDKETGLITAEGINDSRSSSMGLRVTTSVPSVSAFIEPVSQNSTRVRFMFTVKETRFRSGIVLEKESQFMVTDQSVYQAAHEKVEAAAFVRSSIR
jgi:hypothetical protein